MHRLYATLLTISAATLAIPAAESASLTLPNAPVVTSPTTVVKPNVMFVLDDSGSMASDYVPDALASASWCKSASGRTTCSAENPPRKAAAVNGIYYDPTIVYQPAISEIDAVTPMANQVRTVSGVQRWDQVQTDPFLSPASTANIETGFPDEIYCKTSSPSSAQMATADSTGADCRKNGWTYGGTNVDYAYPDGTYSNRKTRTGAPYYYLVNVSWCKSATSTQCQSTGDAVYVYPKYSNLVRYEITTASCSPTCANGGRSYASEMTNFGNWYSYYRTRRLMAKSASGRAFAALNDSFRVGAMDIHTTSTADSAYLKINTFSGAQRTNWFKTIYASNGNSATPLKPALSTVGRMYAGNTLDDPVQYSCQRNIAILTTDGYWNSGGGIALNGSSSVGNQDNTNSGFSTRPKYDGGLTNSTDTLADVAMYYYKNDLRTGAGWDNNVPKVGRDTAQHQHMTTYTVGMGVAGTLPYRRDYETASTGAYFDIKNGGKNWPAPTQDDPTAVDDLWHAAVNGSGVYYGVRDPQSLVAGLQDALREIGSKTGAAAAAATSNAIVVQGDNYLFSSTYQTVNWDGDLIRQQMNTTTGAVSATADWSASSQLNAKVAAAEAASTPSDGRTIKMWSSASSSKLQDFVWGNLSAAQQAWFNPNQLSQYSSLSTVGQSAAAATGSMVSYLRGRTNNEDDFGDSDKPYRGRDNALGDIANSEAAYFGRPRAPYLDSGYAAFKTANTNRAPMVLVGSNDGMLHAFSATTGDEAWSYVPSAVMPKMYKLADKNYAHEFYVDGSPAVGDIFDGSSWRTIVVGGFNAGAKGYFALDVTDPLNPKGLWEFCDSSLCNRTDSRIGYSYGNPLIAKIQGQWKVILTSGYNNSDGNAYLFVLDPVTGVQASYSPIKVNSGLCVASQCGLARINGWVEDYRDNSVTDIYGGDLDGNLYRVQVDKRQGESAAPASPIVTKLGELGGSAGSQPVTTKPELGSYQGTRIVLVGTGRMLASTDLSDLSQHSFYGIKDDLGTSAAWPGKSRSSGLFVQQVLTEVVGTGGERARTSTNNNVDWTTKAGWFVDFPDPGERNNTDATLALGTITFTTNVPSATACTAGGYSWLYSLNFRTGSFVTGADLAQNGQPIAASYVANAFASRPVVTQTSSGNLSGQMRCSDGSNCQEKIPNQQGFAGRRSTWREVITQ